MNQQLLEIFTKITREEQLALDGVVDDDLMIVSGQRRFIDRKKVLKPGEIIAIRPHSRITSVPVHGHDFIEMMYVCKGSITHVIDKADVVLEEGDILMLNQRATHAIKTPGLDNIGVNFIILPEFFDTALRMLEKDNFLADFIIGLLRDSGGSQYLHFKLAGNVQTNNLMENLVYSFVHKQGNSIQINKTLMGLLFLYLLENARSLRPDAPNNYEDVLFRSVKLYIDQHYKTATLGEIAADMRLPVPHLSKFIARKAGFTFKELLQKKRFEVACAMLRDTAFPITDIVCAIGYENNSYFHRRFRQLYSMSPQDFRNSHQGKQPLSRKKGK